MTFNGHGVLGSLPPPKDGQEAKELPLGDDDDDVYLGRRWFWGGSLMLMLVRSAAALATMRVYYYRQRRHVRYLEGAVDLNF